ncbi:MAG: GNAT family N-acetyltransferase [Bowdeniella nasicola]|nr:GNAT family N-acetyltransferase [Bowdeniella nasicola]
MNGHEIVVTPHEASDLVEIADTYGAAWRASHQMLGPEAVERFDYDRALVDIIDYLEHGGQIFVARRAGRIAGLVGVKDDVISRLYIHPDLQGRGIGTALLDYANAQCEQARLTVLNTNEGAQRLYLRKGFRFTGHSIPRTDQVSELEMIAEPPTD